MATKHDSQLRNVLRKLEKAETCSEYSTCLPNISAALSDLYLATKASKSSPASLKKQSAKWAPDLIQILKVALARLSEGLVDSALAQVLASIVEQGIRGLEAFRSCLSGRPIELELHRHAVVCKLIAQQHYDLAGQHACKLLASISRQLSHKEACTQQGSPHWANPCSIPAPCRDTDHDTAQLVAATGTNIVLCSLHAQDDGTAERLAALSVLAEQLQPWLRRLPESDRQRQHDLLSKYLGKAAILVNKSAEMQVTLDLGRAAGQLGRWALRAATAAHVPQRTSQVYTCLAEELPKEVCHALLIEHLEDISMDATEDVTWATAEAICAIDNAMTMEQKARGSERLSSLLLSALQRDTNLHTSLLGFQIAAVALRSANRAHAEDQELSRCLQTASSHLRKLPEDMPGAHSSRTALLTAVLGSMHALQKATMAIQTTADPHLMMAAVEGLQLAPLILKALEQVDPEQKAEHVPNKAYAKIYEQAGACLATALSAQAVQALHAAAQAHQISGSPAASSGRAGTSTGRSSSSSGTVWQRVQQLSEEAVKHMVSVQCAQDLHSSVRVACMASLAPAAAELRYLTALQGQHELQASLDRIFAESWPQQSFPAALHSAFGGCQLSHMLSPEVSACLADGLSSELGPGQTGQQLRQRAADSALQPLQESWRSFLRGALHLLAASRLQREGDLILGLAEATEALRHSGIAMHSPEPSASQPAGSSAPGTWQLTWQYMACLLRNGELYEQLGTWEDALLAFQEGLLMAQSINAQALEAIFSVSLADIHAKQHSFNRAAALLEAAEGMPACSRHMQLRIAAHVSSVRMLMHRLQYNNQGAMLHCQAGIQLASQALQESQRCSKDPATSSSRQAPETVAAAKSVARRGCSRAAQHDAGVFDSDDSSATQSAWHARSQLAQLHISRAECLREAGDSKSASSCLQAARDACQASLGRSSNCTIPLQTAAALHEEVLLPLQLQQQKQGADTLGEACRLCFVQTASHDSADSTSSTRAKPPAGRNSSRRRQRKCSASESNGSPASNESSVLTAVCQLLTAWSLGKAMPSLSRRIAGALVLVLRQLGLPYAAALFMHASLGTAVTAQYAAITASRQAAHKRQAARASGSAATAEAAVEADACSRLLVALQAESFSSGMWDAAAIGQGLDLVQLEAEAKAHLDHRLSTFSEGTPVVTLSHLPDSPDQWLLTRCVRGQAPQMVQIKAAGENAAEELAALLDESAASMHTQKESKAEKAAWWRTRIALDKRLEHLCAGLQTRLGPWLSMLLGQPTGLSTDAAAAMTRRAQECIADVTNSHADLSPAALEVLATLMQGLDGLAGADMASGIQQLFSAAGCNLDDAQSRRIASELRAIAQDAMPAGQSTAGIALQDISNRQRTAAEAPETQAGYLKGKGPALQNLSSASEEAQSCLRSSVCASWTGDDMMRSGREEGSTAGESMQQVISVAVEEADCILRAATRRSGNASSGNEPSSKAPSARRKQAPVPRAAAGNASLRDHSGDNTALSDADPGPHSERAQVAGDDLAQSTAWSTPGPSRRMQPVQPDDVESDDDDVDCVPTPVVPMTARRKGRFAAMQSLEVPATALRPATKADTLDIGMASTSSAAALPAETPLAPIRKEAGRRKVAFAGEVHTSQTAGSESGVRRSRKAVGEPAAKVTKSRAEAESNQNLHGRTPFVLHRAALEGLDPDVGSLGTRLRAMSVSSKDEQHVLSDSRKYTTPAASLQRGPVLLMLDDNLQVLPWESLPTLRHQRVFRSPSLACACATALRSQSSAAATADVRAVAEGRAVDARDAVYMLNPSGDLLHTQDTFQDFFRQQAGWQGSIGVPGMAGAALSEALKRRSMFVYCGHGAGQQHLQSRALRRQRSCAASLLMGCSSGRLARSGQHYEPSGPILAYLLAGCPVAVGNLWDVTDRDIDRFAMAVLEKWLFEEKSNGDLQDAAATERESNMVIQGIKRRLCISRSISDSRSVCRLPHLIGAAPVCYGVPTSVLLQ